MRTTHIPLALAILLAAGHPACSSPETVPGAGGSSGGSYTAPRGGSSSSSSSSSSGSNTSTIPTGGPCALGESHVCYCKNGTPGGVTCGPNGWGGCSCIEDCDLGTTEPCYEGPSYTQGFAPCRDGVRTCEYDNHGVLTFGLCIGQILPRHDICTTPANDTCGGAVPSPCAEVPPWANALGDPGFSAQPIGLSTNVYGDVYYAYRAESVDDQGEAVLYTDMGELDPFGELFDNPWGLFYSAPLSVAPNPGSGPFVVASSPSGLSLVWFDVYFGNYLTGEMNGSGTLAHAVAVGPMRNPIVAGEFQTLDAPQGMLIASSAPAPDTFVAKLAPGGEVLWAKQLHSAGGTFVRSVAGDAQGNVMVVGVFDGHVDFGMGEIASAGGRDVFVAKLDADGLPIFVQRFGDPGDQSDVRGALDATGNILITGVNLGTLDLGGPAPITQPGAFVAKLDPMGNHLWSRALGGSGAARIGGITADSKDNVVITGGFQGTADFGAGPVVGTGAEDVYVARYAPSGDLIAMQHFGASVSGAGLFLALDPADTPIVAGTFQGTLEILPQPLVAVGDLDMFLARVELP